MSARLLVALLLGLAWVAPAAAELQGVGSEAAVGANGTGEACRVRVVQEDAGRGSQRLQLSCDGWSGCNTAGPDGTLGGESLSGLTRPFFWAPFVVVGDGGSTP